jgi:hypothetical protein
MPLDNGSRAKGIDELCGDRALVARVEDIDLQVRHLKVIAVHESHVALASVRNG